MTDHPVNGYQTCGKDLDRVEETHTRQYHIDLTTAEKHGYINPLYRKFGELWADGWTLKHTRCPDCDAEIPEQESRNFALATAGLLAIYGVAALYTMLTGGMVVDPINVLGTILLISISTAEAIQAHRIHTSNEHERRRDVLIDHHENSKTMDDEPTPEELRERFATGAITQDELEEEVDQLAEEERELLLETR